MTLSKIKTVVETLLHLKAIQLGYQVYYRILPKKYLRQEPDLVRQVNTSLHFDLYFFSAQEYRKTAFTFLNKSKNFDSGIDWNFQGYGKLWNYNLQYFNFLFQENLSIEEKEELLSDFYRYSLDQQLVFEPYPISLRSINAIKFFLKSNITNKNLNGYLFQELRFLHSRYEFHLLGNHVLENCFAMLLGGAYFNEISWIEKAIKILRKELDEQILSDGGHFELSPMYHNIILFRVLELIDWYKDYDRRDDIFLGFLNEKASMMVKWLQNIIFADATIPHFNDSADNISLSPEKLLAYSDSLGITPIGVSLGESGYRSFKNPYYEIKVDVAPIAASYQPGHGHADAFSFIMHCNGRPLIVEQGTSTYENNARRALERSTEAHNTVTVNQQDQSQMWGAFRVAKRARVKILADDAKVIKAEHDGFRNLGLRHERTFFFEDKSIVIKDFLTGVNATYKSQAYFHFHPQCTVSRESGNVLIINNLVKFEFSGMSEMITEDYLCADGFNNYSNAVRVRLSFWKELTTIINL